MSALRSVPAERERVTVLDSTGLDWLSRLEAVRVRRSAPDRDRRRPPVVPTVVLAETYVASKNHHLAQGLKRAEIYDLDRTLATEAARLRHLAGPTKKGRAPSAVDAVVMAAADRLARHAEAQIITSDLSDLEALRAHALHKDHIDIDRL